MTHTAQRMFPLVGTQWNPGPPDMVGYEPPDRTSNLERAITVIGTVKNEALPLKRSLSIWARQSIPDGWRVQFLVMDDGSDDNPQAVVTKFRGLGMDITYAKFREPGDDAQRNCTLLFNTAIQKIVKTDYILVQWYDRIPGSFRHLEALIKPHELERGILTSAISRHIGGSSSIAAMTPEMLAASLNLVRWQQTPELLARIAGPIAGHCQPGGATESSGYLLPVDELVAVGGYDERYQSRANFSNVEILRRLIHAGLVAHFADEPVGANYHQSHACPTSRQSLKNSSKKVAQSWILFKDMGCLDDLRVRRNQDRAWGELPFVIEE